MKKVRKPLSPVSSDSEWEREAKRLGLSVAELREQIRLADEIMEEIIREERLCKP